MFHLAAYTSSQIGAANQQMAALSDDVLFIQNNNFLLQQDMSLLFAAAMSVTINRVRLNSPTMRLVAPKYIRPHIAAVIPGSNPNVDFEYNAPFILKGLEEITAEFTHGNAMAERGTVLIGVADRVTPVPAGPVWPLRVTSTTAAVANAWTTIALTFETQLPAGTYSVIGSEMQSTNAIAHRYIFDNQYYRPGFLSLSALSGRNAFETYEYPFGEWGRFRTTNLPRCQVLCNGADAAHEGYLFVVKLTGL